MTTCVWMLIFVTSIFILAYHRASIRVWSLSLLILLLLQSNYSDTSRVFLTLEWIVVATLVILGNIPLLRQLLLTQTIFKLYRPQVPHMSETERVALAAGTVTWEGDLFRGAPDWQKLLVLPPAHLTPAEQAFLDGPVEEVCRMTNDWEITHNTADLSPEVWQYLKEQRFFGIIIPKVYGGKEFSAYAHYKILIKLYGHSVTLATTVGVPNSLGPAELLLHYGTDQQKNHYLPRLATGEEIPCFALTGPEAGSDAGSIPDLGIVCRGDFNGEEIIGIRLNWNKRYITLAPVATVLGLAFKLYDPEQLLGEEKELGITCALIPTDTPGIHIGRRHFPLNAMFQNGPTQGKDIFIPLDWIIGGPTMAGQGWKMLMECLATGRAISLPASAVGGMKVCSWTTGAYARIRKQFNLPIGRFEGIQEALARIAGYTYLLDAGVQFTVAAIDRGEKPSVPSAITKYHATEHARLAIMDAMDIHGGKGICLGPRNYLGRGYESSPIGITVEGANILTRNLIIFGQGAIRCHPYLLTEMEAAQNPNSQQGLKTFDKAFFGHIGFTLSNFARTLFLSLTQGIFVAAPNCPTKRYFQLFTRYSAAFALAADLSMLLLRGDLKRKENLSARLGDILSFLYLGSAVLKHHDELDYPAGDQVLVDWVCQTLLFKIEKQFDAVLYNFPNRLAAAAMRIFIFPYGKNRKEPNDHVSHQVADLLLSPSETRARLTQGIYTTMGPNNPIGILEDALNKIIQTESLEKRLHTAIREGKIHDLNFADQIQHAVATAIFTPEEGDQLLAANAARLAVITVDDFSPEELRRI